MRPIALCLLPLLQAGCIDEAEPEPVDPPTVAELEAAMAGYDRWNQLGRWIGVQPSGDAHGAYAQIWWNNTASVAIAEGGSEPMPPGSLIVKEGYSTDDPADLNAISAIWKIEGYGWFWARFNADREHVFSGQPEMCANCHYSGDDSMLAISR